MKKATVQEATIVVCGESCKVMAYQQGKTVWSAHTKYGGHDYSATGRTASQAINALKSTLHAVEFN